MPLLNLEPDTTRARHEQERCVTQSIPPSDPDYLTELDRMRPPAEARAIIDSKIARLPSE